MKKRKYIAAGGLLVGTFILGLAVGKITPKSTPVAEPEHIARQYAETYAALFTPLQEAEEEPVELDPVELDPAEVEYIGRTIWGEAEGVKSEAERAAVAWCILNRVDAYGQTIEEVVTAPKQFHGYRTDGTCPPMFLDLAADVLTRWNAEKNGVEDVGRVLPADYLYFIGDGERNHFSIEYQEDTDFWDWSLDNPYNT